MIGMFFAAMPESGKPKCRLLRYRIQCVLERSEPYVNRGASRYVRVYIDAEKPAADGGAREIEEG